MKITPPAYFICDYCRKEMNVIGVGYTDISGLNNKSYDMCSDECLKKHKKFLKDSNIDYKEHKQFIRSFFV